MPVIKRRRNNKIGLELVRAGIHGPEVRKLTHSQRAALNIAKTEIICALDADDPPTYKEAKIVRTGRYVGTPVGPGSDLHVFWVRLHNIKTRIKIWDRFFYPTGNELLLRRPP